MRPLALLLCSIGFSLPGACAPTAFSYNLTVGPVTSLFPFMAFNGWSASWQTGQILFPGNGFVDLAAQTNFITSTPGAGYSLQSLTFGGVGLAGIDFLTAAFSSPNPNSGIGYGIRFVTPFLPETTGTFGAFDTDVFLTGGGFVLDIPQTTLTIVQATAVPEPSFGPLFAFVALAALFLKFKLASVFYASSAGGRNIRASKRCWKAMGVRLSSSAGSPVWRASGESTKLARHRSRNGWLD